jgi:signal recognition particle receptor subunit beta
MGISTGSFSSNARILPTANCKAGCAILSPPMVLFNHATREMTAKIVYYGPGLCGKTTNLMVIFDKLDPKSKGKMLSLATKTDRTLFFDLLPVDIGKVGPFSLKIQLYTVPGQVFYNETRKLVLKGADSVVFVADSQPAMIEANRESFANLLENLEENQIDPNDTPIVVQFNKRDLPGVLPVEQLQERLGFDGYPYTEASALKGDGVMETFRLVSKITAKHLFARLKGGTTAPKKPAPGAAGPKVAVKPAPAPEPEIDNEPLAMLDDEPLAEAPNPFGDSVPFPDSAVPVEADYDAAEEVSLDQLLAEGRTRPETIGGDVAVPILESDEEAEEDEEEVEELGAESLLIEPPPETAGAQEETAPVVYADSRVAELESQIASLEQKLQIKQTAFESILRELDDLRARVSAQLES